MVMRLERTMDVFAIFLLKVIRICYISDIFVMDLYYLILLKHSPTLFVEKYKKYFAQHSQVKNVVNSNFRSTHPAY